MRHVGELRVRYVGDAALGQGFLPEARKYVAQVDAQRQRIGPGASLSRRIAAASGAVFDVVWAGDQPVVTIDVRNVQPGAVEEVIHLYVTGNTGLEIVDLGTKQRVNHVGGLADYEVDAVARGGNVVYLTGQQIAVRVDISAETAIGASYEVLDVDTGNSYYGLVVSSRLNYSEDRLVLAFDRTVREDGLLRDGLGGLLIADAETLASTRPPIRMGFDPCAAWARDGRLFSSARITTDTGYPDPAVMTALNNYIAVHVDGVLQGTALVATSDGMIPGGEQDRIRALAVRGDRLFALVQKDTVDGADVPRLRMYDISDPDVLPTLVASVDLPFAASTTGKNIAPHHATVVMLPLVNAADGDIVPVEVVTEDGLESLVVGATITRPEFSMVAVGGVSGIDTDALQAGPKSRRGNPPDARWFFLDKTGDGALLAFRDLTADAAEYTLDLADYDINKRFRLLVAGERARSAA